MKGMELVEDHSFLMRIAALVERMEYGPDRTPVLPYRLLPPPAVWWADGART